MNDEQSGKTDWPAVLFVWAGIPFSFFYGGVWVGLIVLAIGMVALGWSKRHDGPLPTNKPK